MLRALYFSAPDPHLSTREVRRLLLALPERKRAKLVKRLPAKQVDKVGGWGWSLGKGHRGGACFEPGVMAAHHKGPATGGRQRTLTTHIPHTHIPTYLPTSVRAATQVMAAADDDDDDGDGESLGSDDLDMVRRRGKFGGDEEDEDDDAYEDSFIDDGTLDEGASSDYEGLEDSF